MNPDSLLCQLVPAAKCTLGCPILDRCLGGGIPCKSVTEIVAESGSGKTQLCLQLCLYAQLPLSLGGLSSSSVFLHSEFPFPSRRLHQLSLSYQSLYPKIFPPQTNNGSSHQNPKNPCDNIFVQSLHSVDQLLDVIFKMESFIVNGRTQLPVRLIVIDSIAALFRADFDNKPADLKKRSGLFFKISAKLKQLATRFDLAVVVTNQVVDFVGSDDGVNGARIGNLRFLMSSGRRVCPALGLAWANCVNSRIFLSREDGGLIVNEGESGYGCRQQRRRMHIVFAPHLPPSSCAFFIKREGVFGVDR